MLCTYRYYVRPNADRPGKPLPVKREEASSSPPSPPESQGGPVVVDVAPHVAIVRQYAW